MMNEGLILGSNYLWTTWRGVLYSTDITNGQTTKIIDFGFSYDAGTNSQFFFTEHGVFVLEIENQVSVAEFFFYDFETKQKKHLFTIDDMSFFLKHRGVNFIVRDIAVRPEWVEQRFASTTDAAQDQ